MLAMGVLSSWVTALRKESWRSLRRTSRTRKTVLRTTPAMRRAKRMMPRTSEGDGALVEDDPGDVEGDGDADEEDAEGDEEGDGSAASGDVHGVWWKYSGGVSFSADASFAATMASETR